MDSLQSMPKSLRPHLKPFMLFQNFQLNSIALAEPDFASQNPELLVKQPS